MQRKKSKGLPKKNTDGASSEQATPVVPVNGARVVDGIESPVDPSFASVSV